MRRQGFTLIELLIVVAIIAILAAIAVPNFLEAQTRAKVARVRADQRTAATAIETYRVDWNSYPQASTVYVNGKTSWQVLSTPIAYITTSPADIFAKFPEGLTGMLMGYNAVSADNTITTSQPQVVQFSAAPSLPATRWWFAASRGPDRLFGLGDGGPEAPLLGRFATAGVNEGNWLGTIYDPTNGTLSVGNIYRAGGAMNGFAGQSMQH